MSQQSNKAKAIKVEVNIVFGILYEVKAKAIIDALVEKVENKTLGERLAAV